MDALFNYSQDVTYLIMTLYITFQTPQLLPIQKIRFHIAFKKSSKVPLRKLLPKAHFSTYDIAHEQSGKSQSHNIEKLYLLFVASGTSNCSRIIRVNYGDSDFKWEKMSR